MLPFRKPAKLRDGDRVAIVSPSRTVPSLFPRVAEKGIENLRNYFQLDPVVFPHAFEDMEYAYAHPEVRADDLNMAFKDQKIKAIISSIGGDESGRILKLLDLPAISDNVKTFTGYSDCTTITSTLFNLGIASIYGGAVMAGFAQMENFPPEFERYWNDILKRNSSGMRMSGYDEYSQGYPNWKTSNDPGAVNEMEKSPGWNWIVGDSMTGRNFAANIEVLDWLRGTPYFPKLELMNDTVLLLETSEEVPSPLAVQRMLRNLGNCGVLERIRGLAFGRFRGYNSEMHERVIENIKAVLTTEFSLDTLPLVEGIDFGHTDPYLPIPVGINIRLSGNDLTLLESYTE